MVEVVDRMVVVGRTIADRTTGAKFSHWLSFFPKPGSGNIVGRASFLILRIWRRCSHYF
jgi:hypothetical protein